MLLFAAIILAILLASVVIPAWLDGRRRRTEYAMTPSHDLVERARALLEEGDPGGREGDSMGDSAPWEKADLLGMLSRNDYRAMLQTTRPGGGWWYSGPEGMSPEEDMRRMSVADRKNSELRLILTTLSQRPS